jgi:hypothetical protein
MAYTPPTPYGPLGGQVGYGSGLQFVDMVLSNVAKQYRPTGFLYDEIVSPMSVEYNTGRYPVFDPAYFFSTGGNLNVADKAATPVVDFQWSHDVYQCLDYRLQTIITRKEMVQAHPALRLDYSKTVGLLTQFALNREVRLATKLQSTTSGGQFTNADATTPTVKWDAGVSGTEATIQKDLQTAALTVYKTCGRWPNTLIINKQIALAIAADFTVRETIKYLVGPTVVREGGGAGTSGNYGILPDTLYGFRVLVADGTLYNKNRPGQSASLTDIWGNQARLVYRPDTPEWGIPAKVYSFRGRVLDGAADTQPPATVLPTGDGGAEPGGSGGWAVVDRWWDYDPPAEHIRAWECVDERVVAPETGIVIPTVVTAANYS